MRKTPLAAVCEFEIEGMHKNAVCIDGKYENHIFMTLLLGEAKN